MSHSRSSSASGADLSGSFSAAAALGRRWGWQPLIFIGLIGAWHLLAVLLQQPLLPQPSEVLATIWQHYQRGELMAHLGATLERVAISFVLAMLLGSIIGIAMGLYPGCNRGLDPLLITGLNIPALVVILLLYIWLGMGELAAIAAVVINKVPNVVVTLREGARCLDPQLDELARVYRLSRWKRLTALLLPQLAPYFLIAARSGLALIWKIVLVVELLGRSDGVGFQLHLAFQMFDVPMILAYSFSFIVIVYLIEWLVLQPLDRLQQRWRKVDLDA
ncbi:ABC transporter permease [Motiliproteus coralliicola]|uniref:ABC transporter permease n=1 Tax=Motiliproteus coralliicola TaxID=2283196 RepID=A0A369WVS8_9GAMM|nr:ABC transporter permease [Motiliproteus coralliicola]RDE25223.1 ABC transporter permease [Motiliproteus coralliicola]